ncbi:MAG: ornithine cyclodeaminase [Acidimicrobiales bacterium]|nr:ornithine cyclodeaminase [Acidimicrobiales bacterium]
MSGPEVEALLDVDELVEALGVAMADLSAGLASVPPRVAARVPEHAAMLAVMPAFLPSARALTTKIVSLFPENRDRPTHQALICCFDADTGTPLALMDGTYITAARTAAGSVLASLHLARSDARVLSIIGSGVQARAHARAFRRWSGLELVRIAARRRSATELLVAELVADGMPAEAAPTVEEAVRSADIVCAATHADRPVVRRSWLRPGTHVNSVGYNTAGEGEIDGEVLRDALIVVESRDAVLAPMPSGAVEIRRAIEAGIVTAECIHAEIGEIVAGTAEGRRDDQAITLYKSVGVAVQDAAAAALVLRAAASSGTGTSIDL